jgi:hypothetical protein
MFALERSLFCDIFFYVESYHSLMVVIVVLDYEIFHDISHYFVKVSMKNIK